MKMKKPMKNMIKIFKNSLCNDNINEQISMLNSMGLDIQDGFAFKDTAYVKEGFDE